ncbi:MAG: GNAT family N-acetyltransferase [Parcubacteria group bacterium]|nr:GNAT family N-acetyltransferase [Parcubacteria group bacterium]
MKKKRRSKKKDCVIFRKGKRVFLGPIELEHVPLLTKWINDPEVNEFLTIIKPNSSLSEEKWVRSLGDRENDVTFGIFLFSTGEMIGVIGLHQINNVNGTATTGTIIGEKNQQNKGYGTEAKMLLLEYAFNTLNLRKICSQVYDFNGRSRKCLEKCGYKLDGGDPLKAHVYRNGNFVDLYNLAVFKDDFLKLWAKYKKKYLA